MNISVVMTTYNGQEFIIEQLDSIKRQTRTPDEVLIFDDRSSDDTVNTVQNYIGENGLKNWTIKTNTVNKGYSRNFYEGVSQATGDIVFCCDQDDIWDKKKIEAMVACFEKNSKIQVLCGNYSYKIDSSLPQYMKLFYKSANIINHFKDAVELIPFSSLGVSSGAGPGWTLAIKIEYFDKISPFYTDVFSHDGFFNAFSSIDLVCYKSWGYTGEFRRYSGSTSDGTSIDSNKKSKRELRLTENYLERVKVVQTYLEQKNELNVKQQQKFLDRQRRALEARKNYYLKKKLSSLFRILYFWNSFNPVWVVKDIMNYGTIKKEG